ncbi:MAG: carboxypeptidase regulatory-like domain-containing protein [Candidatus Thermoplasmatota archaeon]|nr:carboxypeptidase regulatory-like domain-containing protein [Candidatus Thermoplasmatota archaeon]
MKKITVISLTFFVIIAGLFPVTLSNEVSLLNSDVGSLSGYITDEEMNPISNAEVTIRCAENSFICFSNESGFYHRDDIPIVFCLWNISVNKEGYQTAYHDMSIGEHSIYNFTLFEIPVADLDISINSGFSFPSPLIRLENTGNVDLHNLKVTNISVKGNVLYNSRELSIANTFEPGHVDLIMLNTWMIGYGAFTLTITISCDEGEFVSQPTNGLIVGPFMFIP